jgi:hypothetical protein
MKVELLIDVTYIDVDLKDDEYPETDVVFHANTVYDVVYTFKHDFFGRKDHTVYVIMNKMGETISVSAELCREVKDDIPNHH